MVFFVPLVVRFRVPVLGCVLFLVVVFLVVDFVLPLVEVLDLETGFFLAAGFLDVVFLAVVFLREALAVDLLPLFFV